MHLLRNALEKMQFKCIRKCWGIYLNTIVPNALVMHWSILLSCTLNAILHYKCISTGNALDVHVLHAFLVQLLWQGWSQLRFVDLQPLVFASRTRKILCRLWSLHPGEKWASTHIKLIRVSFPSFVVVELFWGACPATRSFLPCPTASRRSARSAARWAAGPSLGIKIQLRWRDSIVIQRSGSGLRLSLVWARAMVGVGTARGWVC